MNTTEIMTVTEIPVQGRPDRHEDHIDEKIVSSIERACRNSFEYRNWVKFLKSVVDLDRCAFYAGYAMSNGLTVELHHHPIRLAEMCRTEANKLLTNNQRFTIFEVAEIVMRDHYSLKVGIVPLNPTAHELFHGGELELHPDLVLGEWEDWYDNNKDFHSPRLIDEVESHKALRSRDMSEFPEIMTMRSTVFKGLSFEPIVQHNLLEDMRSDGVRRLDIMRMEGRA